MTMVRTFQACETTVQTATVKGDATEARYHKACHATYRVYISKKQSALCGEAIHIL